MGQVSGASTSAASLPIQAGTAGVAKETGELKGNGATQYRVVDSEDKVKDLAWSEPKAESQGGYAASTLHEALGEEAALKLSDLKAYDKEGKPLELEGKLPEAEETETKGVYKIPLRLVGKQDGKLVVIDRYIYLRTGTGDQPDQDTIKSTLWYETEQIRALNDGLSAQSGAAAKPIDKEIFEIALGSGTFKFTVKTVGEGEGEIKEKKLKKLTDKHEWVRLDVKDDSSQAKKSIGVQVVGENALFKRLTQPTSKSSKKKKTEKGKEPLKELPQPAPEPPVEKKEKKEGTLD